MSKLLRVLVTLPAQSEFRRSLHEDLDLAPGEARTMAKVPDLEIPLPQVIVEDIAWMAGIAGWRLSDFYTYLIVQGAIRLIEHGQPIDIA